MRVAFHSDETEAYEAGFLAPEVALAQSFIKEIPVSRRHLYIMSGSLIIPHNMRSTPHKLAQNLLGLELPSWSTLRPAELEELLSGSGRVCAHVVEGLIAVDARSIHEQLLSTPGYLGALEVRTANRIASLLYVSQMPATLRVVGHELRVFHRAFETNLEDSRDHEKFDYWRSSRLFRIVEWEDIGVRDTIFDPYISGGHLQTIAETEQLLEAQFDGVVNELLLRIASIDPRLIEPLHGALKSLDMLSTADSLAHVSLSCRRFLEGLANALQPPKASNDKGKHKLGLTQYRNRLWNYVQEQLSSDTQKEVIFTKLEDIGKRIDAIDSASNAGIHSSAMESDVRRLLISLTTLAFDLLTLGVPPLATSEQPYRENILTTIRSMLRTESS